MGLWASNDGTGLQLSDTQMRSENAYLQEKLNELEKVRYIFFLRYQFGKLSMSYVRHSNVNSICRHFSSDVYLTVG